MFIYLTHAVNCIEHWHELLYEVCSHWLWVYIWRQNGALIITKFAAVSLSGCLLYGRLRSADLRQWMTRAGHFKLEAAFQSNLQFEPNFSTGYSVRCTHQLLCRGLNFWLRERPFEIFRACQPCEPKKKALSSDSTCEFRPTFYIWCVPYMVSFYAVFYQLIHSIASSGGSGGDIAVILWHKVWAKEITNFDSK